MQPIFLLIGPPAVGKSSTSKALAARFPRSIHLPVDDIRNMVVSGIALPGLDWSAELVLQVRLARESVIHTARVYQAAGFAVVIDDFYDPNHLAEYQHLLKEPDFHPFVLYPDQAAAHARNFQRSGDDAGREYIDAGIRIVYQQLNASLDALGKAGWTVVDTTDLNIEETVTEILKRSSA